MLARMTPPSVALLPDRDRFVARTGDVRWFYTLTFGVTWGIAAMLLLARPQVEAVTGTFSTHSWLYFLAVYSPTLSAIVLTAARDGGAGLRRLGRRAVAWRVPLRFYVLVLVGWPVMDYVARVLQWAITGQPVSLLPWHTTPAADGLPWYLLPALLISTLVLDAGPLGEEIGQRGYVLPRLLARRSALVAALEVGVVWGAWHIPAFFISGTAQHDLALGLGWLILGATANSVLMTWISIRTGGGVLVAGVLVHLMINVAVSDLWATTVVYTLASIPAAISLARVPGPAASPRATGRHARRPARG